MRTKIRLAPEEIREYNRLKQQIQRARTSTEVQVYKERAKHILDTGKNRYLQDFLDNKQRHMTVL